MQGHIRFKMRLKMLITFIPFVLLWRWSFANCYDDQKYPQFFYQNDNQADAFGTSLVASEALGALFLGGLHGDVDNRMFIMRTDVATARTKWRRFYQIKDGNLVSAMAVSPDATKLLVFASERYPGTEVYFDNHAYIF